jgi:hypothetical protein
MLATVLVPRVVFKTARLLILVVAMIIHAIVNVKIITTFVPTEMK